MNKKECPECRGDFWLVRDLLEQNEEVWVCKDCNHKGKQMNESEYYADEFTDAELHAMADAGEVHLDKGGFVIQLTDAQLDRLADHGQRLLDVEYFKRWMNKPPFWKE